MNRTPDHDLLIMRQLLAPAGLMLHCNACSSTNQRTPVQFGSPSSSVVFRKSQYAREQVKCAMTGIVEALPRTNAPCLMACSAC